MSIFLELYLWKWSLDIYGKQTAPEISNIVTKYAENICAS